MATDEKRPHVSPNEAFDGVTFAPLPEGTKASAVFALIQLTDKAGNGEDEWCVRTTGAYNRVEFLGALSAYTHSLLQDEARGWLSDDDEDPAPVPT